MSRFTISSATNPNSVFVHDSKDNSREKYTLQQLRIIRKTHPNIKIDGLDRILKQYKNSKTIDRLNIAGSVLNKLCEYDTYYQEDVEVQDFFVSVSVRDYGEWVYPPHIDGDEMEDYDWMEPSSSLVDKLDRVRKELGEKYPDYKVEISSGEKNWIYVNVYFVYA
jgi:hypothetical protein